MSPARRKLRMGGRLHVGMGGRLRRNPHKGRRQRPEAQPCGCAPQLAPSAVALRGSGFFGGTDPGLKPGATCPCPFRGTLRSASIAEDQRRALSTLLQYYVHCVVIVNVMTRDEYERRKQRIEEQLRAGIELMESAHRAQMRALDLVWMVQAEEDAE